jgi:hypothetical protein
VYTKICTEKIEAAGLADAHKKSRTACARLFLMYSVSRRNTPGFLLLKGFL